MKVQLSLNLEVLSFEGFGSHSLVYDDIFRQLSKLVFTGDLLGDRLVLPHDKINVKFELSKA